MQVLLQALTHPSQVVLRCSASLHQALLAIGSDNLRRVIPVHAVILLLVIVLHQVELVLELVTFGLHQLGLLCIQQTPDRSYFKVFEPGEGITEF